MSRKVVTIASIVLAVGLALLAILALLLPRLIQTEEFDRTLRSTAAEALGRPVDWQRIEIGLLPPRLTIESPGVEDASGEGGEAVLSAGSIDLRLAWWPLLRGRTEIDSLVVRGLRVELARTETGWVVPLEGPGDSAGDDPTDRDASAESLGRAAGVALVFREFVLEDGRVVVHDRTRPTPSTWEIDEIRLHAEGDGLDRPIALEGAARLRLDGTDRGTLRTQGHATTEGDYVLTLDLESLELGMLETFVDDLDASGLVSGRIEVEGRTTTIASLDADLRAEKMALRSGAAALQGELSVAANVEGDAPIAFEGMLDMGEDGRVPFSGTRDSAGAIDARARFEDVDLRLASAWLPEDTVAEGRATGGAAISRTEGGDLDRGSLELSIPTLRLARGNADVSGALDLQAGFQGDAPIAVDARFVGSSGGKLEADGTAAREGDVDLALTFTRFDLAIVQPLLPDAETRIGGLATGRGRLVGNPADPTSVELDLEVSKGLLRTADLGLEGPLHLVLDAKSPLSDALRGTLDLELTRSDFTYGEAIHKKAGERAVASLRLEPGGLDRTLFRGRLKLRNVDPVSLQGHFGGSTSVTITTPAFDLSGWSETLPALAPYAPRGSIAFDGFRFEPSEDGPARLGGRIDLRDLSLRLGDSERLELHGVLTGEGPSLRTKDLLARAKGLRLSISGVVEDPFGQARSDLSLRTAEGTESNAVLSAWTSVTDTLYGALLLDARLKAVANGPAKLVDTLGGRIQFSIGKNGGGRLRGAPILARVLDQFPAVREASRVAQALRGGRPLSDYFREDFEIIEGDLEVANGSVTARQLRLAYDGYEANLLGTLRLDDLGLDMKGELVLESDLVHLLTGVSGTAVAGREPLTIPLAGVTGTLSDPKVSMTPATLATVPKALLRTQAVEDALRRGVSDALGRVLGGNPDRNRQPRQEGGSTGE